MAQPPYHGQEGSGSGITRPNNWPWGLWGDSDGGPGVVGTAKALPVARPGEVDVGTRRFSYPAGVYGESDGEDTFGVYGLSAQGAGVRGEGSSGPGMSGSSDGGTGVTGMSRHGDGMQARTRSSAMNGIFARNDATSPSPPDTPGGNGVFGLSTVPNASGVFGANNNGGIGVTGTSPEADGIGLQGSGGRLAGRFVGDVEVHGDIRLMGADCAEDFDIADAEQIEPGTVVVIDDEGVLRQSWQAYDKRVAGVVSGAGGYKPGLILDKQQLQGNRKPVALLGKAYCKVDASDAAIEVGDLLTTSPTPGHAMKATDPLKAFGAVIGKALRPIREHQGLIPILIALQ
jgi:hypothetical protein